MTTTKQILSLLVTLVLITSCKKTENNKVSNTNDYEVYLNAEYNEALVSTKKERQFWIDKLNQTPNQFPYLSKIAAAESQLFQITGNIDNLIRAEENLIKVNELTNYNSASNLRALSRNYISQHRFKEALILLKKAEANGENLEGTQKMLFDVYLELGDVKLAKQYLGKFVNLSDFDYLIRTSKWNDHIGNLEGAIKYMEKAVKKVEAANNEITMQWAYTNLADFYGHAGKIKESYNYFLKALELDPNDAYAKKGIAWIIYSHERDANEALRILNAITEDYYAPDYDLLKAEVSEFLNNHDEKSKFIKSYRSAVTNIQYGDMYNSYNVKLNNDKKEDMEVALALANREINNRPTAQSYDLLAWTYYNKGLLKEALQIVETNIKGKTFEPEVVYHMAEIYKANGYDDMASDLKPELLESAFELGPLAEQKIKLL
ncbi:cell surface protein [Flavobacteriaceae bacterium AU392]|nr:cell surface protein [Flavobacteriaceae bacterium]RKM83606.1 cell surface protein [Flavobacteriaceae bacterium AU392]